MATKDIPAKDIPAGDIARLISIPGRAGPTVPSRYRPGGVMVMPPSEPRSMRSEFAGSIQMA